MTSEASFWMVRLVVAVLGLGVGGWATWLLYTDPAGTRNWKVVPGIVGTALGLLAATRSFPYTSDFTISGFPFPLAFFQREGTRWVDYISDSMGTLLLANCAVGIGMANAIAYAVYRATSLRRARKVAA